MRQTFKDEVLEKSFQKDGYTIVPFLDEEEISFLKKAYFDTLKNRGGAIGPEDESFKTDSTITYDFTFIDKNVSYKKEVFDLITQTFEEKVNDLLLEYKPIIANFIRKEKNAGEVPLHQNWAFVDEKESTSVSIWCPLVDSNSLNGTLEVVPGSHKRFGEVRGPMIRSELLDINQEIIESQYMQAIEIKAGDAVVLDDSIVHYSAPNQTDELRLAIQLILIPKEKSSIHYHMDLEKDKNRVEVLEVDHNFYMEFNPWKKPSKDIKRIRSFEYQPFSMEFTSFKNALYKTRFDQEESKSLWNSIKAKWLRI